jgi:AAA domain
MEYTRLDRIDSEPLPWLWERRIPLGGLTVLFGQPKVGKGVITASLATMVTLGTLPGDLHGEPGNVMIAWSEDPNASTILRPQIEVLGGNPRRIAALPLFKITEKSIARLKASMEKEAISFLVLDQLLDFLDPRLADKLGTDAVRSPLTLLNQLGNETGAAVMVVLHETDKVQTGKIMNSTAFKAVPRAILRAYGRSNKTSPSGWKGRKLQAEPSNRPTDRTPLAYDTVVVRTDERGAGMNEVIKVTWLSDIGKPVTHAGPQPNGKPQVDLAAAFLREILDGGPVEVSDIMTKATKKGLSKSALDRASRGLVKKDRVGFGRDQVGVWTLK